MKKYLMELGWLVVMAVIGWIAASMIVNDQFGRWFGFGVLLVGVITLSADYAVKAQEAERPARFEPSEEQPPIPMKKAVMMLDPGVGDLDTLMDPRGDGTLQEGDALFDILTKAAESGDDVGVFGRWNEETGAWDLELVEQPPTLTTEELDEISEKWEPR